jgi:hypothetical protein
MMTDEQIEAWKASLSEEQRVYDPEFLAGMENASRRGTLVSDFDTKLYEHRFPQFGEPLV